MQAPSFASQTWKVCCRKHPSSFWQKQPQSKHSQLTFCKVRGECELGWKLFSQRKDSMFLPLTRSQDSALFRTFKFIPEAKSRSITVNKIEHNTRIVQDSLIFSTSLCFFLNLNANRFYFVLQLYCVKFTGKQWCVSSSHNVREESEKKECENVSQFVYFILLIVI